MRRTISSLSTASLAVLVGLASGDAGAIVGGPDAGGYTFADEADGATFNYVDIQLTGTLVASGDDVTGNIVLGAPFSIYGVVQNDMAVSSNGFLTDLAGEESDLTNSCPMPAAVDAPSFRIAALHDDLVTDVFYQFFTEAEAAAVGFPGETAGISIFQWQGNHFSGVADGVDAEVVLFHDDNTILTMVNADSDGGTGSTIGIQDNTGVIGLNYGCNLGGYTTPGVTAVEFTAGVAPDSDCCTPSAGGIPGCTNQFCQDLVCGLDAFCCDNSWDGICAGTAATDCQILCGAPPPLTINEIRTDQDGADNDEYFEISGPPGFQFQDVQYIVLGDTPTGEIETVVDLTGQTIPPSGLFVAAEGSFSIGVADFTTFMSFENNDTVTHMLVGGLTANVSDNLDGNADGVLDEEPWVVALDTVALIHPPSTDLPYGPPLQCAASPTCQEVNDMNLAPEQVFRCPDTTGMWMIGNTDITAVPSTDTPGAPNDCPVGPVCGDGIVDMGEDCDDMGESATCDADCTTAACGDGTINMTAGELCDDAGESAACNADCTVATCGDGVVNVAAGEDCDDMGESAMCNADCTAAACGDGVLNMAAGEECDDGGESAACDVDCTAAMCGDGVANATAGENCDDGGRSAMCNADCTSVMCGDGVVNMTAGEECDDSGESAACDDDCTNAMCGDAVVNATAGEDCDGGGETADCNDDCTPAMCGDGVMNATAGEECDDGNTDDLDGCAADCTNEDEPGTTGDTGSDSTGDDPTTGADSTAGPMDSSGGGETTGGTPTTGPSTVTMTTAGSSGGDETDTDASGGVVPGDEGCNCSTTGSGNGGAPWSMLALFGLVGLRLRRRRAA